MKKKKKNYNLHIDSFFSQFVLNRMHQKMHVRFQRDTILSQSTDFIEKDYFF